MEPTQTALTASYSMAIKRYNEIYWYRISIMRLNSTTAIRSHWYYNFIESQPK